MASRDGALARALTHFDSDGFRDHLAELVAIPSTSQDLGHEADVQRYLADAIQPWLERMGFAVEIHPNPIRGFGPILFAERLEGPDRPQRFSMRMSRVRCPFV
jgi:acetylornithine deacetylase/succinyl-diaminopimelate desuccinylase-like protein